MWDQVCLAVAFTLPWVAILILNGRVEDLRDKIEHRTRWADAVSKDLNGILDLMRNHEARITAMDEMVRALEQLLLRRN